MFHLQHLEYTPGLRLPVDQEQEPKLLQLQMKHECFAGCVCLQQQDQGSLQPAVFVWVEKATDVHVSQQQEQKKTLCFCFDPVAE